MIFVLLQSRRMHRARFISVWGRDILAAACLVVFLAAIAALTIEFPDGVAQFLCRHAISLNH